MFLLKRETCIHHGCIPDFHHTPVPNQFCTRLPTVSKKNLPPIHEIHLLASNTHVWPIKTSDKPVFRPGSCLESKKVEPQKPILL
jgi:hypothetical protein